MIDTIEKEDTVISEEEAAQYDRQIRLWGLDAQKRFVHIHQEHLWYLYYFKAVMLIWFQF